VGIDRHSAHKLYCSKCLNAGHQFRKLRPDGNTTLKLMLNYQVMSVGRIQAGQQTYQLGNVSTVMNLGNL